MSPFTGVIGILLTATAAAGTAHLPFDFEPNLGQFPAGVSFGVHSATGLLTVDHGAIHLDHSTRLVFTGGSATSAIESSEPVRGVSNYRIGNDPRLWTSQVPRFKRLRQPNLYPAIDLELYGIDGRLEYDFLLQPQADPRLIRLRFDGAQAIALDSRGNLVITSLEGQIVQRKPRSFQNGHVVESRYHLVNSLEVGIELEAYDSKLSLRIDPVVETLSLVGGSSDDRVIGIGSTYIAGMTSSLDFPNSVSSGSHTHSSHVFVHFIESGDTLIIGGSGTEVVTSVSMVDRGNFQSILIAGYTDSPDLPVSPYSSNSYPGHQPAYGGGSHDGFLMYLYSGSYPTLITYVGGSGDDRVTASALLPDGSIAAFGTTTSTDLPAVTDGLNPPAGAFAMFLGTYGPTEAAYFGGSGADTPLAAAASGLDFYVGGETASTDWSPEVRWTGSRHKGTDAFVLHFHSDVGYGRFAIADAMLFGGDGDDRATALAIRPDGSLAVAGTTQSVELAGYRGGASDAFLMTVPPDLNSFSHLTLIGGSGADEATSVASNGFFETAVGGWTNSPDLALHDPIRAAYGGAGDGFLYYADDVGEPICTTYVGGSGADRIQTIAFDVDGLRLFAAGVTGSTDLPLQNSEQPTGGGAQDGFYTALRSRIIHARSVVAGKDLSALVAVSFGDPTLSPGLVLKVTSSDPSNVLLAELPEDQGAASLALSYGIEGNTSQRSFHVYCLADHGSAAVILAANGFPSRSLNVRCVPSGVAASPSSLTLIDGSSDSRIAVVTGAIDPDTGLLLEGQPPRSSIAALQIGVASDDPSIAAVSPNTVSIDAFSAFASRLPPIVVKSAKQGQTTIRLTAPAGWTIYPPSGVPVKVEGISPRMTLAPAAKDTVVQLRYYSLDGNYPANVQYTSSDPGKVLLTSSPGTPGRSTISGGCTNGVCVPLYLEVLDASDPVSITASLPGSPSVTQPVKFQPIAASLIQNIYAISGPATSDTLFLQEKGSSANVKAALWSGVPPDNQGFPGPPYLRSAAAPVSIRIVNSNSSAVSVSPSQFTWIPGTQFGQVLTITALDPGAATLTLQSDQLTLNAQPLTVTVPTKDLLMSETTVGKNLQDSYRISLLSALGPNGPMVTLTSSDPSRLLLSLRQDAPGAASVQSQLQYGVAYIYTQALADSGDVTITATSPDANGPSQGVVHLGASAFVFDRNSLTLDRSGAGNVTIASWLLDSVSLTPRLPQLLRPGIDVRVSILNSNPDALALDSSNVVIPSGPSYAVLHITTVNGGRTKLTIVQPDGFVTPPGRGPISITAPIQAPVLTPVNPLGVNLQTSGSVDFFKTGPAQVALSSGDPSKLLLSTSSFDLGKASVTLRRQSDGTYTPFYYQAIDGPADIVVTATGDGFDAITTVVSIAPAALFFGPDPSDSALSIRTSTAPAPKPIGIGALLLDKYGAWTLRSYGNVVRAGLDPIPLQIDSSNPGVAVVANNPVPLNGLTASATAQVQGLAGGKTLMTMAAPRGFRPAPPGFGRTLQVLVDGPAFKIPDLALGKDLQTRVTISLANGPATLPADLDVTLTSSNPSAVLLSADGQTPGSSSLTLHLNAGAAPQANLYVQGLSSSGSATIQIAAPGYGASQALVTLADVRFFGNPSSVYLNPSSTTGTVQFFPTLNIPNFYTPQTYQFRAGLEPFDVTAYSSDSAVFIIPNPVAHVKGGDSIVEFSVQSVGPGAAKLTLNVLTQPVDVQVQGGSLSLYSDLLIPKDFQDSVSVGFDGVGPITITSSDPARVLLSLSPTTPGQASVIVSNAPIRIYVQALASSGIVTLTATGSGYPTATSRVTLSSPSLAIQTSFTMPALTPLSPSVAFSVQLEPNGRALRPGAPPVTLTIGSLDPSVGLVTPPQLIFSPGDGIKTFSFQPQNVGSTVLTLSLPAGYVDIPANRQKLINVIPSQLSFATSLNIGKDLARLMSTSIAGGLAKPLTLTLTSSNPSQVLLASSTIAAGTPATPAASISIVFPAGVTTSSTAFYLIGLASAGTVSVQVTGAGWTASTLNVTLQPSGFVFYNDPPTVLPAGQPYSATLSIATLWAVTLAPASNDVLRPGAGPITVTLASSNEDVIATSTILWRDGDGLISPKILPKASGTATLTIIPPSGYTQPGIGGTATISVH